MKKLIFLGILTLTILVSGCELQLPTGNVVRTTQIQEEPFCADSYFEYQTGKCCLDANSNNVCDEDDLIAKELEIVKEKIKETPVVEEAPEVIETGENLFEDGVPEECPYTCEEEYECKPILNADDKISRWTCVFIKE